MIRTGLVSVTFRQLSPETITSLAAESGLSGIEWGGDVHVPHGDTNRAREVSEMTAEAGLVIISYGSYLRVGTGGEGSGPFERVLETALALGAPTIRVWAGDRGSEVADEAWWARVVEESREVASLAAEEGVAVAFEFHGGTLTDRPESACQLLREVDHANMGCYWQPIQTGDLESRCESLTGVLPWLANLHVFHWTDGERRPLREGREEWRRFLAIARQAKGDRYAMLEFVRGDDPAQFLHDAEVLKEFVEA